MEFDIEEVRQQYADACLYEEELCGGSPDSTFDQFAMEAEHAFTR